MGYLTTASEVKRVAGLTNEYSNTELEKYIADVEVEIYADYPYFKHYSEFTITSEYDDIYYIGDKGTDLIYSITKVREETDTNDAGWQEVSSEDFSIVPFEPAVQVPVVVQTGSDTLRYRIDWIPKTYNRLATLMTKRYLLSNGLLSVNNEAAEVEMGKLDAQLMVIKRGLRKNRSIITSSNYASYNPTDYVEYEQYDTD